MVKLHRYIDIYIYIYTFMYIIHRKIHSVPVIQKKSDAKKEPQKKS